MHDILYGRRPLTGIGTFVRIKPGSRLLFKGYVFRGIMGNFIFINNPGFFTPDSLLSEQKRSIAFYPFQGHRIERIRYFNKSNRMMQEGGLILAALKDFANNTLTKKE